MLPSTLAGWRADAVDVQFVAFITTLNGVVFLELVPMFFLASGQDTGTLAEWADAVESVQQGVSNEF